MTNPITNLTNTLPVSPAVTPSTGGSAKTNGFASTLASAIEQVEQLHTDAQANATDMMQNGGQDLHNVMIAVEKADIAFQLMMQVRNKIVNAYQEISRLQF
ncbi:MAG TPA: flagellar hook-basal body complex protein FliE [Terriglobales bacterium]|nr:flagellar hook-basal body complex protein FliE [Terriglobales bacterium]